MKKSIVALALGALLAMPCISHAEDYYYWYKDQKIYLERGDQQYLIYQDDLLKESDKAQIKYSEDINFQGYSNLKWGYTEHNAVIVDTEHVLYSTPSFKRNHNAFDDNDDDMFVTHRFYVKLKSEEDLPILQELANQYQAEIDEEKPVLKVWYILRCKLNPLHNALELANIFHESGKFEATEPEFINTTTFLANPQVSVDPSHKSVKILRDGLLFIERDGKTFNAIGQIVQ